jgi:energy-coupling factor transport system substrate-specific component
MKNRLIGHLADLFVFTIGLLSLAAPFVFPQTQIGAGRSATFPIMVSLILILCLIIVFFEAQRSILDNKMIAFLGVLIAINAGLRFLENAIPGPAGFSPTFFLIILVGYFFGSRMGFLMGAMTMFISGLITGGVGPWLPGQMITAGWVGQTASLLSLPIKQMRFKGKSGEILFLTLFSASWGMLYGIIMNLWFWPFLGAAFSESSLHNASILDHLNRYGAYYLATSIVWDITRTIGNILIMSTMARPFLKIFQRFHQRFSFHYESLSIK